MKKLASLLTINGLVPTYGEIAYLKKCFLEKKFSFGKKLVLVKKILF